MIREAYSSHRRLAILSLTILVLMASSIATQAQVGYGYWYSMANSIYYRQYSYVATADNKLIVAAGVGNNVTEIYDPNLGYWYQGANFPGTTRANGSAVGIGSKFYLIGGCLNSDCNGGVTNQVAVYDVSTNEWSSVAGMNEPRATFAAAAYDGMIYVAGGTSHCGACVPLSSVERYNPYTNTWEYVASLPDAKWSMSSAAAIDGKIYVVGGSNGSPVATGFVYDIQSNTWSSIADAPVAASGAGITALNGYLYLISGVQNGIHSEAMYIYNPVTNVWSQGSSLPVKKYNYSPQTIGGSIYVAGAAGENGAAAYDNYIYYPDGGDPLITGFTCYYCTMGETMTIYGSNFSIYSYENLVQFNGVQATIVSNSTDYINVIVPVGATDGLVTVTVNGRMAIAPYAIAPTIPPFPKITQLSPEAGNIGSNITIYGENFSGNASENIVYFGDTRAEVLAVPNTSQLYVKVPAGATYKRVSVTVNGRTGYSNKPFTPTFAGAANMDGSSFASYFPYGTYSGPVVFETGDVDNDGKTDVVVVNYNDNLISVYHNTSTPGAIDGATVTHVAAFSGGATPQGVALGDADGDGRLDIAINNYGNNTVYIYRNLSSPGVVSFESPYGYSTGYYPVTGLAFQDFDLDGKVDLAFTNSGDATFSVMKNVGSPGAINFNTRVDYYYGANPQGLVAGDLDGDGKPDIAIANRDAYTVTVFRNTSSYGVIDASSFELTPTLSAGAGPHFITMGDLDADAKPELVVANTYNNTIYIYKNTSTPGTIDFGGGIYQHATASYPYGVTIGEVNGDGQPDIVVGHQVDNLISVFQNGGSVDVFSRTDFSAPGKIYDVRTADIDADGRTDLLATHNENNSFSIWRNLQGIEPVAQPSNLQFSTVTSSYFSGSFAPAVGLVNGYLVLAKEGAEPTSEPIDGTFYSAGQVLADGRVVLAANETSFFESGLSPGTTYFYKVYAFYDNGAGMIDYRVVEPLSGSVATLPLPAITGFSPASGNIGTNVTIYGTQFSEEHPAFNIVYFGDTKASVIGGTSTELHVIVPVGATHKPITVTHGTQTAYSDKPFVVTFPGAVNMNSASFAGNVPYSTYGNPTATATGDINGDGKTDVVVVNTSSNYLSIYRNNSTTGAIDASTFSLDAVYGTGSSPRGVALGDADGDGRLDIAVTNNYDYTVYVYRNTSNGGAISFEGPWSFSTGQYPDDGLAFEDFDLDGKADLAIVNYYGYSLSLFHNISEGGGISFESAVDYYMGVSPNSLAVGDMDGDGKPDVAVVNPDENSIRIFRNTSTIGTIDFTSMSSGPVLGAGTSPNFVALGDVDLDGMPELVVTNSGGNNLFIYRNNNTPGQINYNSDVIGHPTFGAPSGVRIGDVNGDGKPDIVVAHQADTRIYVLQNYTTPGGYLGDFTGIEFNASAYSYDVNIADFDGDGRSDILATHHADDKISVFRNIQSNEPVAQPTDLLFTNIATNNYSVSYTAAIGQVSGYIVITKEGSEPTSTPEDGIFYSTGQVLADGQVVYAANELGFNSGPRTPGTTYYYKIYSFYTDGTVIDYRLTDPLSGSVTTLPLLAINGFAPAAGNIGSTVTVYGENFNPDTGQNIVYFGDTRAAVLSGTPNELQVQVPLGATYEPISVTSDGLIAYSDMPFIPTFAGAANITANGFATNFTYGTYTYPHLFETADMDGDGKTDVVFLNYDSDILSIFRGNGTPGVIDANSLVVGGNYSTANAPQSIALGDADADGMLDVAVNNYDDNTVSIYRNISTPGNVALDGPYTFSTGTNPIFGLKFEDFDQDGKADLAFSNYVGYNFSVMHNTSSPGSINFEPRVDFYVGTLVMSLAVGDLDGDGKPDIAAVNRDNNSLMLYRNTSTLGSIDASSFTYATALGTGSAPHFAVIGDLDLDGKQDIAATSALSNTIYLYRNIGSVGQISFENAYGHGTGNYPYSLALGDVNGDGKPDIVVANEVDAKISVFQNNTTVGGSLSQFTHTGLYSGAKTYDVKIADIDGDGMVDIIGTHNEQNTLSIWRNQQNTEPTSQPTDFAYSDLTATSYTVSFTAASGPVTGYIAIAKEGSEPTAEPLDGEVYPVGTAIGDGVVVYAGPDVSFSQAERQPSTQYYYKIYSFYFDGSTPNYRQVDPLTGSVTTYPMASSPAYQPTAFTYLNVTSSSYSVQFEPALDQPESYIALRFTYPEEYYPQDGQAYSVGSSIGSGYVAYIGSVAGFEEYSLAAGTAYYYKIFSFNGTDYSANYLQTDPLTGYAHTLATEPSFQPYGFGFSNVTTTSAQVYFSPASDYPMAYIVLRRAGSPPTSNPADATGYSIGEQLGDAVVAYVGTEYNFTDYGLTPGTAHYYSIYSLNHAYTNESINYLTTAPLTGALTTEGTAAAEPTSPPTSFSVTELSNTSFSVHYTASPDATGYIVLRATGSYPTGYPVDHNFYGAGQVIGDGTVAYVGSSQSFSESGMTPGTYYYYKVYAYNEGTGSINYLLTGLPGEVLTNGTAPATEPASQPYGFNVVAKTDYSLSIDFSPSADATGGYIVIRKQDSEPTTDPVDFTPYTQGTLLGDGVVAQILPAGTMAFTDVGLAASANYYYKIYAFNGEGSSVNFLVTNPLVGSAQTLAAEPQRQPSGFAVSAVTGSSYDISATAATGNVERYLILGSPYGYPSVDPVDGIEYPVGEGLGNAYVMAYAQAPIFLTLIDMSEGETNYYKIYSVNGSGSTTNYLLSAPLSGYASTRAAQPPYPPSNLVFGVPTNTSVDISFDHATTVPSGYLVIRRLGELPASEPVDGTAYSVGQSLGTSVVAYMGPSNAFTDYGLLPASNYYYSVFSFNQAATDASINYLESLGAALSGGPVVTSGAQASEPANPPTLFTSTLHSNTSFSVQFTAATDAPSGYIVLRRTGDYPADVPVDQTAYTSGQQIGDAVVAYVGSGLGFTETGMAPGTLYYYRVYSYNELDGSFNYLLNPLSGTVETGGTAAAPEPLTQPTGFAVISRTANTATIGFTASEDATGGYLVVRKELSAPTTDPEDFNPYGVWANLGDAYVVQILAASTTSFVDDGMSAGTAYYYKIYAFNGSNESVNYLTANPLEGSVTTLAVEPSEPPSDFTIGQVTTNSYFVSFTDTNGNAENYIALRSAIDYPSSAPVDGTAYLTGQTIGDATVVYIGDAPGFYQVGLSASSNYYYKIYSFNGSGGITNYLEAYALLGIGSTRASEPANQPTNFAFTNVGENSATISYTLAVSNPNGYIAIRKEGSLPTSDPADGMAYEVGQSLGDGVVAYIGNSSFFDDYGLLPGSNYYYRIYSFNTALNSASTNYLQYNPLTGGAVQTLGSRASEPLSPPTNVRGDSPQNTSLTVLFDAAANAPSGYIAIRAQGAYPTGSPVDESFYTVGSLLGDGVVAYVGPLTSFNDAGLIPGTNYHYRVYAYNENQGSINYLLNYAEGIIATTGTAPAAEPVYQAVNLTVGSRTSSSLELIVEPSSEPVDGFIVLRKEGSLPVSTPEDYTAYQDGDILGDAVVAAIMAGDGTPVIDDGLNSAITYHYRVYAFNGSGMATNYLLPDPLEGTGLTLASDPFAQPTGFVADPVTNTSFVVTFATATGNPTGYIALRNSGDTTPSVLPQDGVEYSVNDILGNAKVVLFGSETEILQTNLSQNTSYRITIYSMNGTGASTNYLETEPLQDIVTTTNFAQEPTAQPTGLTFSDKTHESYTVSFTPATGSPAGYIGIAAPFATPGSPVDGQVYNVGSDMPGGGKIMFIGGQTSWPIVDAAASTAYNYAIYAFNGSGSGNINYRLSQPLTGSVTTEPLPAPPVITDNTVAKVVKDNPVTISAVITDVNGVQSAIVYYGKAEKVRDILDPLDNDIEMVNLPNVGGNNFAIEIPGNQFGNLGLVYVIYAKDINNIGGYSTPKTVAVETTSQGFGIPIASVGKDVSNYNIISVPLSLEDNTVNGVFGEELGPYDNTKWRMYRYMGGSTKNQELTGNNTIEPGKGYWLITTIPTPVFTGAGTTTPANSASPFRLAMTSGWNQIGNPYTFNLSWATILEHNSALGVNLGSLKLYKNGNWVEGSVLNAFGGGFVNVGSSGFIEFPVIDEGVSAGRKRTDEDYKTNPIDREDWEVTLNIESGFMKNTFAGVGMNKDASEQSDKFDDFTLPRFFRYLELNHEKRFLDSYFTRDIVPSADNHIWEFSVESNADYDNVTISWDNSYFGNSPKQLILWDVTRQYPVDMRRFSSYVFDKNKSRKFMVLYGEDAFIRDNIRVHSPLLHEVFPNPLDDKATFAFSVPESTSQQPVQLEVFDLFGKKISTLLNKKLAAGYHEVVWEVVGDNGVKPSAGVYVTYLSIGEKKDQMRIIIVN